LQANAVDQLDLVLREIGEAALDLVDEAEGDAFSLPGVEGDTAAARYDSAIVDEDVPQFVEGLSLSLKGARPRSSSSSKREATRNRTFADLMERTNSHIHLRFERTHCL
jgi:hypothetical protein